MRAWSWPVIGAVVAIAVLAAALATVGLAPIATSAPSLEATVVKIVDGDTIHVQLNGRVEKVRYIGVNTPEIHHPTKGREPYGDVAREMNRRTVEGKWVTLVYDVQQRDKFGRVLAYVYVNGYMVNGALVHWGYAEAATYPPNVRHAEYFRGLDRAAREAGRGLWGDKEAVAHYKPPESSRPGSSATPSAGGSSSETGTGGASAGSGGLPSGPRYSAPSAPAAPAASSGGSVNVQGYTTREGTYVAPHTRSAPRKTR